MRGQSMSRLAVEKPNFAKDLRVIWGTSAPTARAATGPRTRTPVLIRQGAIPRQGADGLDVLAALGFITLPAASRTFAIVTALPTISAVIRPASERSPMPAVARKQLPLRPAGSDTTAALLDWYDRERRDLPWRAKGRRRPDPYKVWLSEIMLQQTTVKAVVPYYQKFLKRWPTVCDLAAASLDDVLAAWSGLGYYARARSLHACARAVVEQYAGKFPKTEPELLKLPGIGPYTAAAVAAIAFGEATTPVDGNVERVVARLFAVTRPLPASKREIRRLAATLTPPKRAGDFAQAMMDLGAEVCTPKRPSCLVCPLQQDCHAHASGIASTLPKKLARQPRPVRSGVAFLALREDGAVLLRRRPPTGLLGGMLEVPSTEWSDTAVPIDMALAGAPIRSDWWTVPGCITHTFTHFTLELQVLRAIVPADAALTFWAEPERCTWVARQDLARVALPSLMRKVVAHALKEH